MTEMTLNQTSQIGSFLAAFAATRTAPVLPEQSESPDSGTAPKTSPKTARKPRGKTSPKTSGDAATVRDRSKTRHAYAPGVIPDEIRALVVKYGASDVAKCAMALAVSERDEKSAGSIAGAAANVQRGMDTVTGKRREWEKSHPGQEDAPMVPLRMEKSGYVTCVWDDVAPLGE